jgi:hypothetical protein
MLNRSGIRLYSVLAGLLVLASTPASAQFQPRPLADPATGEKYIIEGSIGFWRPNADIQIQASQFGITGTEVNLASDLGLTNHKVGEAHVVFRPFQRHKLRFQYIPLKYDNESYRLTRKIIFQGQQFDNVPVNWLLDWKAYRFGYEYDFITRSRGFGGVILDAKYTDVYASIQTPANASPEFVHARGPIPAIGGIARFYVTPNISVTGELTGITIPDSLGKELEFDGHYADLDIYGTLNFTNNVGAQIGYRSFDVGVSFVDRRTTSTNAFVMRGLYFGIVARY